MAIIDSIVAAATGIQDQIPKHLAPVHVGVGEYKGMLRAHDDASVYFGTLSLLEIILIKRDTNPGLDYDELLWFSGAEAGKQKEAGFAELLNWVAAYQSLWNTLITRPVINTQNLERFMTMALGSRKRVRKANIGDGTVYDEMKQIDAFLHLDTKYDAVTRGFLTSMGIRKVRPFHKGSESLSNLLPGIIIALEFGLPLPVYGQYRQKLTSYTTKDIPIVLDRCAEGIHDTVDLIDEIRNIKNQALLRSEDLLPARMQNQELMNVVFSKPVLKVKDLVDGGIVQRQTAAEYLRTLEEVRFLSSRTIGREVIYRNEQLCDILLNRLND